MTHSLVYRMYTRIKNIYVNSIFVNSFSNFLAGLFHIFINSKIFHFFTRDSHSLMLKESFLFKIFLKFIGIKVKLFEKLLFSKTTFENSYFVNYFLEIFDKKDKKAINSIYLLIVFSMLYNMTIKIITGTFIVVANKNLIFIVIVGMILYALNLDYKMILRESKIINIMTKIINDEGLNDEI